MQGVDLALIMHKLNHEGIAYTKRYLGITISSTSLACCLTYLVSLPIIQAIGDDKSKN